MRRPPAFVTALLALGPGGCGEPSAPTFQGYVEGEYLYLAAPQAGYLKTLDSPRGSRVQAGQILFAVATDPDLQALAEAEARSAAAREKLENLKAPHRPPEIAALAAQLDAARSALILAETQLARDEALAARHFVSAARVDEARARREQSRSAVAAAREALASYRTPLGREAEVRGAAAEAEAAGAQAAQKRWLVERKAVAAPAAGEVADTYYRPGEWVPAGAAVASLLPDARRRLRFFVPETALAGLAPGQPVEARCDACPAPIRATIDFIAPAAEYTPPVIYSRGSREKLVFRVEAAPAPEAAARLRPGLPLDVRLGGH